MSDSDDLLQMLLDQAGRLFGDLINRELLAGAERGETPAALAEAVDSFGLADALVVSPEDGGIDFTQASTLFALLGYHAVPMPLGETMLARAALARAGVEAPGGGLGLVEAGALPASVAHAGAVTHLVVHDAGVLRLIRTADAAPKAQGSFAREARVSINVTDAPAIAETPWPQSLPPAATLGAMLRASQIAGGVDRVLALSLEYANTRQQFGRPIGRFQAIQQLLARLAAEVAAAQSAADSAWAALDAGMLGLAPAIGKIRTGEAARVAAAIGHQVHGAIGVTDEHMLHYLTRRLWEWRLDYGSDGAWAQWLAAAIHQSPDDLWTTLTRRADTRLPTEATE